MEFNSIAFFLIVLPIGVLVFNLLRKLKKEAISKSWLIGWSLFVFSFGSYLALVAIISSLIVNFYLSRQLLRQKNARVYYIIGILFNLILVIAYKYHEGIVEVWNLISGDHRTTGLITSISIGFLTIGQLLFIRSVYRKEINTINYLDYLVNITFIPGLLGGIFKPFKLFVFERFNIANLTLGVFMVIVGLFKKVVLADTFGIWADAGFSDMTTSLNMVQAWIISLSYTFQLYFDLTGLLNIAMGIGLLFGVRLSENYASPYRALNLISFWGALHKSMNEFFKKFFYGKESGGGLLISISLVFFIIASWHGLSFTNLIWVVLMIVGITVNYLWYKTKIVLPKWLSWLITFNYISISWVFFRATTLQNAKVVIGGMMNVPNLFQYYNELYILWAIKASFVTVILIIGSLYFVLRGRNAEDFFAGFKPNKRYLLMAVTMLVLTLIFSSNFNTFIINGF